MKKSQLRFEVATIAGIGLFAAVFLIRTYDYPRRAALFPRGISIIILFLLLLFIASRVRRYLKKKGASAKEAPSQTAEGEDSGRRQAMPWILTFGIAAGFLILIYLIGFAVAALCYLVTHIYLTGYRNHKVVWLYALVIGMALISFEYLFAVSLPKGILVEMIRGNH
jgi:hypothetical protein